MRGNGRLFQSTLGACMAMRSAAASASSALARAARPHSFASTLRSVPNRMANASLVLLTGDLRIQLRRRLLNSSRSSREKPNQQIPVLCGADHDRDHGVIGGEIGILNATLVHCREHHRGGDKELFAGQSRRGRADAPPFGASKFPDGALVMVNRN